MDNASGSTRYCYDRFGQMTRKVQVTNGQTFALRYSYTKGGHLGSLTYPDGSVADYVRDAQGRVTEVGVTSPGGAREVLVTGADYYPFGPAAGWTYGNGRRLDRVHDLDYRPTSISDPAAGGLDFGYSYDPVGNLTALHTADLAEPPRASFDYDPLGRLTAFRDGAAGAAIESYGYDATGNRTSFANAGGSQAYSYPADSHRLAAVAGVARSYDNAGNTLAIGPAREFVYNAANRMSQAKQGGAMAMHYVYNGKGEQVRRHLGASDTTTIFDEAGRWLGDYDAAGTPLQQAVWLDDFPVGLLVGASGINRLHYVQPDHLGTPRAVIDPVRNLAVWNWDLASEAFGNSPPNEDPDGDGAGFVFDMRFPGQRYDAASGVSQNYFRDYEPGTGRYSQSDPIGLNGGLNTYRYAYASPLKYMDPSGLSPCEVLFCSPSFSQERLVASAQTSISAWRLENVHVEPVAVPPVPPTRYAGLLPLPMHLGKQVAQCFYSRIRSYTDLYERYSQKLCLEACVGGDCDGGQRVQWKVHHQRESLFEKMRRERNTYYLDYACCADAKVFRASRWAEIEGEVCVFLSGLQLLPF